MSRYSTAVTALGVGTALVLGAAAAGAQAEPARRDTARTRTPVTKEQPAPTRVSKELPPPPDTTVAVSRGEVSPTPTPTPPPPAAAPAPMPLPPPPMPMERGSRGFFVGVGGGAAFPTGTFDDIGYNAGAHVSVPIGWRPSESAFGVRATFGFDQTRPTDRNPSRSSPKIYSGTFDLLLQVPSTRSLGGEGLWFYGVAGGGGYQFRGFGGSGALADALGNPGDKTVTKWGAHLGGGVEWRLGMGSLFAESRWVNVFTKGTGSRDGTDYLRFVPVLVGVTFR